MIIINESRQCIEVDNDTYELSKDIAIKNGKTCKNNGRVCQCSVYAGLPTKRSLQYPLSFNKPFPSEIIKKHIPTEKEIFTFRWN